MNRSMILPLSLLLSSMACSPGTETPTAETMLIDYEVEDAASLASTGVAESGADVVIELKDFGKTEFGALEEPYDTTVVEQDGYRISLDRASNFITFSGAEFSKVFSLNDWVAEMVPIHGEGWCTPDPSGAWPCGEVGYYLPLDDMSVEFQIPGGSLTLWMTLVQGEWNLKTETFRFGRINGFVLVDLSR